MSRKKHEIVADMERLLEEYAQARLEDTIERLRSPARWSEHAPRVRLAGGQTVFARILAGLSAGPMSARQLRELIPEAKYRTINGTIQTLRARGEVVSVGRHGTKTYQLTDAGRARLG